MNILDYIPQGRANAVTRRELGLILNLPDRLHLIQNNHHTQNFLAK